MSAIALDHHTATHADRDAHVQRTRPRLLSYVGRWGRARRWLPSDARDVFDVGCAFGYGTVAIAAGGPPERRVVGVERDHAHIANAARRYPWLSIVPGDVASLPAMDHSVDAIVMLDVLEHVADPSAALAEIARVLRSGGTLIISVPHAGLLTALDSLNVYPALRRRFPNWPPLDPADDCDGGHHHHFTLSELQGLLGEDFVVDRVARTGLGLCEPFRIGALVIVRALFRMEKLHDLLMAVYFVLYLLDDLVPMGPAAYYLTVRARAVSVEEVAR